MKTRILATLLCATLASYGAVAETLPGTDDSFAPTAPTAPDQGQLEILLAPIALYPDALVALILPAATHSSEIVLASRFLSAGGKEEELESQLWDESVKALARFPEVVDFMDENLGWTQDVGDAFVAHPAEVMGAIQALRARGARNGTLATTPQQEVVFEDDSTIRIIPAEPTVIYVPYYEPSILYPSYSYSYSYFPSSLVWFGVGYGIGSWLSYDCDWRYRTIYHHHHRSHWGRDYDWRRRYKRDWDSHVGGDGWSRWAPSTSYRRTRPRGDFNYARTEVRTTTRSRLDGGSGRFTSNTTWTEADRDRYQQQNSTTSASPDDRRSVRRPDSMRNPPRGDRTDTNRTVDNRRDRPEGDRTTRFDRDADGRRTNRPSDNLRRNDGSTPVQTVTPAPRESSSTVVNRRNEAPVGRAPAVTQRRPDVVDRRPDVARTAPVARRETSRPTGSGPTVTRPAPAPARNITSGADIRRPQPARSPAPSPAPARASAPSHAPARVSNPPPQQARVSRPAPAPAPSRQQSYSAPRSESPRSSPPQSGGSIRHGRPQTDEN